MSLEETEVEFKSEPEYFKKELSGRKSNTVRDIDLSEQKFRTLVLMMDSGCYGWIKIIDPHYSKKRSFRRKITDITIWKNQMIISWYHPP